MVDSFFMSHYPMCVEIACVCLLIKATSKSGLSHCVHMELCIKMSSPEMTYIPLPFPLSLSIILFIFFVLALENDVSKRLLHKCTVDFLCAHICAAIASLITIFTWLYVESNVCWPPPSLQKKIVSQKKKSWGLCKFRFRLCGWLQSFRCLISAKWVDSVLEIHDIVESCWQHLYGNWKRKHTM